MQRNFQCRVSAVEGRFAGIQDAVNFYSQSDEVLQNPSSLGLGGAWSKQELFKGVSVWKVVNGLHIENVNVACEGGWGINPYFAVRPDYYLPLKGFIGYGSGNTRIVPFDLFSRHSPIPLCIELVCKRRIL